MNAKAKTVKLRKGVYINREFSWLKFDLRVLDQALDDSNPVLEKCKFLSIFCSNMDEFFMVRMGRLYDESVRHPLAVDNKTGLTGGEQLFALAEKIKDTYPLRAQVYSQLKRELKENSVNLLSFKELSKTRKAELTAYFRSQMLPLLSPMVLDAKHPLIHFENCKPYMLYKLKKGDHVMIGVMEMPQKFERLYRFRTGKNMALISTEEIIRNLGWMAFQGYDVQSSSMVRFTRNANFDSNVEDADVEYNFDFSKFMKSRVDDRTTQNVMRVEYQGESKTLRKFLHDNINIDERLVYPVVGDFEYKYFFSLARYLDSDTARKLSYPPFRPYVAEQYAKAESMVEEIRKKDVLLSYPFDGMDPLISLLNECAGRKDCVAIKITIYRLANQSKIVEALRRASENGIEVTAVMELCARFDEENNIRFASVLQEAGCNVIYGFDNYKVHSKIISIVFSDENGVSYITHLGTGNYNESTAKQYTDLNILTADREIGEDGVAFFRNLSICNVEDDYRRLLIAPKYLKSKIIEYIDGEIKKAKAGEKGVIVGKMNSLTDRAIINKLVEASQAGVQISLIVRGICCLLPGKKGMTENIRVVSIVGRFLEHSRIYCFGEGDERVMYISSADLMTRNTDKRVEIATPVLDKSIRDRISRMLSIMLSDNVKGRQMLPNGNYTRVEVKEGDELINSQEYFLEHHI